MAIVATARKVSHDEMQPAVDMIRRWGFRPVEGRNLYKAFGQFAGTDDERAADLQDALDDDGIRAILFARGGYGTVRIVDRIDLSAFGARPKWLAGFSDATVLHAHIRRHAGVETIHGPMAINVATASPESLDTMRRMLAGERPGVECPSSPLNREGSCTGPLTGGNLSLLYALAGTPSDAGTDGAILFLEDLDEHLYHVDRMMMTLRRSGKLAPLAGLIVGDVSAMRDNTRAWGFGSDNPYGKTAEEIIHEHVAGYDFPVCFGFPAGHRDDNRPLILGAEATLEVGAGVRLSYAPPDR